MEHTLAPPGEVHAPHQWIFANQAARLAAVISAATEINKLALQVSDGTYWRLTAIGPTTWAPVGSALGLVYGEVPAGAVDGANMVFTLVADPAPVESCQVFVRYAPAGAWFALKYGFDFTLAANAITLAVAPNAGASIVVDYSKLP